MNPMREVLLDKVVLNLGVGEGGERLEKAEKVLEQVSGMRPKRTLAKKTIREWRMHKGDPIGCMVTVRGERGMELLRRLLKAVDNKLKESSFDRQGNFSFGIREHIDIPGIKYDPDLGVFGMDVCVSLRRRGYRIMHRRRGGRKVPKAHRVTKEEAIDWVKNKFGVQVV
jgi:large subunit ribosomal protein L5